MPPSSHPSARWLSRVSRGEGPIFRAIVDAMAGAVRDGDLQPGDQLPPQRAVAETLGVDLTTVTRAYAAARARGLIEGAVGRGTFVRSGAAEAEAGLVDLTMNLPPPPQGVSLGDMLRDTTAEILRRTDPATLMAYHPGGGSLGQRAAGAAWLKPVLGDVEPERLLVAPGAQAGLAAALAAACRPGDTLIVEPLVYPGVVTAAAALGLKLAVCPTGADGLDPDALGRLAAETGARAVYVIPTTQNPTATTLDAPRRRALAATAQAHDLWIVEDDPYSRLFDAPLPALATLAPERTFHLATLSKTLAPGLRLAYLRPPPGEVAARTAERLSALTLMPAPLMTAVVTAWIRDGDAERLLAGVRKEARARRALAAEILPQARGAAEGLHVWIDLPGRGPPGRLRQLGQARGVSLVSADAFAAGPDHPEGLRISLGGPSSQAVLRGALEAVAAVIGERPGAPRVVV